MCNSFICLKLYSSLYYFFRPKNAQLISESSEVELGEVCLHPDIEQILSDEQWINDASGLMPHCLAILKLCHLLTNRIIALTMANISQHRKHNLESFVQVMQHYECDGSHEGENWLLKS